MTPARSFALDLARGKAAETDSAVLALLRDLYPEGEIRPAAEELDRAGIDLVIHRAPFPVGVQVKVYAGTLAPIRTARVFLEDFSDIGRAVPGWLWTTRAEVLVARYADAPVAFHVPTLRAIAEGRGNEWTPHRRLNRSRHRGAVWTSAYWAVPLREVIGAILDPTGEIIAALSSQ
ncbi:hypothetical protein TthSNM76_04840 [Thermus thermophilus]|nr:hypothetical protein TthSNM76_04840 [Thermus thermophilus]